MASELLKRNALIQKLKEPDVPEINFDLQSTGFEELFTLPEPKPEELLNIQEENRKGRLLDSLNIIGGGLEDTSLDFIRRKELAFGSRDKPKRGLVDEPGSYAGEITKENLLKMRTDGMTISEIAEEFGVSKNTISNRLQEFNLQGTQTFVEPMTERRAEEIRRTLPDGVKLKYEKAPKTKAGYAYRIQAIIQRDKKFVLNKSFTNPTDDQIKTIVDEYTKTYKKVNPGYISPKEFEKLRFKKENVKLTDKEFAEVLNAQGKTTKAFSTQKNIPFTERSVANMQKQLDIRDQVGKEIKPLSKDLQNRLINNFPEITNWDFDSYKYGVSSTEYGYDVWSTLRHSTMDKKRWNPGNSPKSRLWHNAFRSAIKNKGQNRYRLLNDKGEIMTRAEVMDTNWSTKSKQAKFLDTATGIEFTYDTFEDYLNNHAGTKDPDRFARSARKYKISKDLYNLNVKGPDGNEVRLGTLLDQKYKGDKKIFKALHNHHNFDIAENFWDTDVVFYKDNLKIAPLEKKLYQELKDAAKLPEEQKTKVLKNLSLQLDNFGPIRLTVPGAEIGKYDVQSFIKNIAKQAGLPEADLEKLVASIGCPDAVKKADGGRIGFQDGKTCFLKGQKAINTGKIPEGAAKKNFIKFANKAAEIGKQSYRGLRTFAKIGIIPEAIFIGADTLLRTGMGDTLDEAFKRATALYRTDGSYEQADALELKRIDPANADTILNLRNFYNEQAKLSSLEQQKEADLALAGDDFAETNIGMTEEEIEKFYAPKIQEQENNLFNASISDAEERAGLAKEAELADKKGVKYKKSPVGKILDVAAEQRSIKPFADLFATDVQGEPDVSAQVLENYLSGKIDPKEEKQLQNIIDSGGARGVLDAMKKIESAQQVPEGAIRESNVFDEERKTLFELAKTDPALAERLFGPSMTLSGDPIDSTDLQDEMNLDRGIYALGGRIGFAEGPKDPNRRLFLKIMGGLMSLPIVGKFLKPAAPLVKKLSNTSTAMPDWFPDFINKVTLRGFGKKIDEDIMKYEIEELPGIEVYTRTDGRVVVSGKNQYEKTYEIEYEPPGYEVIDHNTGKTVKTQGDFMAQEEVPVNVDPDGNADFDVEVIDDLDDILGPDTRAMEEFTTGKEIKEMKRGEFAVGKAEADAEAAAEIAAELDEIN